MHHCSGRDPEGEFDGVAQGKQGGWAKFSGKINSRRKPVLLFLFPITAADTSAGRCRKLSSTSHLWVVQGNLWLKVQGQAEELLGEAEGSQPGAAETNSATGQLSAQHEETMFSSSPESFISFFPSPAPPCFSRHSC